MIYADCPNCGREVGVDEEKDIVQAIFSLSFTPKRCECGEKYIIEFDCDDEEDAILILNFYEYAARSKNLNNTVR